MGQPTQGNRKGLTSGVAVFDATPLIAFHQIGEIALVRGLFAHVLVPTVVAVEVAPSLGVLPDWIDVQEVNDDAQPAYSRALDPGERAAIALAWQRSAGFVVLDDLAGRLVAADLGMTVVGSLGLLVRAKRSGLIREVGPLMDAMIANGLYTGMLLRRQILSIAEESER